MKAKVTEMFSSIQGEGKYVGVKQVFLRFFGCHMHCSWCDTPLSIGDADNQKYDEYDVSEVLKRIIEVRGLASSISLTGGEPLLQKDFIKELIPELKKIGLSVYLESSGILYQELESLIEMIDVVSMDIKLPSSTQQKSYWQEHVQFLRIAKQREVFVKIVVSQETEDQDIIKARDLVAAEGKDILFIVQPNYGDMHKGVIQKCLQYQELCQKRLNNVRIILQMHKFMKLR
ncbi:7-carboxy-7-deazaguanine synthase [hydrothermal vent metagenome]|uniref:7-carboxy-7-deazaguanine synthase n=1 Tax=hydrothermal vent metagenome TaxID=652676 RepID=A0A3B1D740_9ZZZZ